MDFDILFCILLSLVCLLLGYTSLLKPNRLNLPPTPLFCLPFIGHLHLLKHPVHQTFQNLSQKYGHVFSLKFGSRLIVLVSSPSVVQECFTKNDIILANRPSLNTGKYLAYNNITMAVSSYGEHWRNLRRISTLEIFSMTRVNSFLRTREDEVKRLLCKLCGNCYTLEDKFRAVDLKPMLLDLTFNIVMRMVGGKKFCEENNNNNVLEDEGYSKRFREVVTQIMAHSGSTNPEDFIPLWNWIDPTGFNKRIMKLGRRADEILQGLVDEIRNQEDEGNNMIHHLLRLQNTDLEYYSDQVIKGLIHDILIAGIDTTAVTLEWALSHLLNNPIVLERAKAEIDCSIGQERMVNEADLSSLSYLQGIISETLRLSPPGPLLVPHCASEDCKIGGYDIPRKTIVLINVWAIHRDPNLWEDATSFKPERHANVAEVEYSYKLLPFGLGRRACPGMAMAQRIIGLTLASLIQCFEWKRTSKSLVDMSEGKGLTMPKVEPIMAKCRPRLIMKAVLSEMTSQNI
ncbi:cytochrome P450 81Q32-like [Benincasa hispida]|uniref:cytochrome P450 81Q32-like n=1 Tax=Benincasa hispida TaxID=102211 RepID=UPI001900FDD4|nr:cytochrome P450 81Q32-like [Benincasa hispida]